jgi:hypothetical protein
MSRIFEGTHSAIIGLTCPECGDIVNFSFDVVIHFTESDTGLPMEIIRTGQISDQPLFDHKLERHGPDAEGLSST